jgi:hypothetical protein
MYETKAGIANSDPKYKVIITSNGHLFPLKMEDSSQGPLRGCEAPDALSQHGSLGSSAKSTETLFPCS